MPTAANGWAGRRPVRSRRVSSEEPHLAIGLINNMPASSQSATIRQFRNLIAWASDGISVRLSVYASAQLATGSVQGPAGADAQMDLSDLWDKRLDGLIVTGSEPAAQSLTDEPNWSELASLVDWATENTNSVIWSCLAAHAAVYRLDGVPRRRLPDKLFGLFECEPAGGGGLAAGLAQGLPGRFWAPHSRWNDVCSDIQALSGLGYVPLIRSQSAGTDAFFKQLGSLFIFCQGHPEYESDSLLLEYRRDVARFLRRESELYPDAPRDYFSRDAEADLNEFRERAVDHREEELLEEFPFAKLSQYVTTSWRAEALGLYRNWLRYLSERKTAMCKTAGTAIAAESAA